MLEKESHRGKASLVKKSHSATNPFHIFQSRLLYINKESLFRTIVCHRQWRQRELGHSQLQNVSQTMKINVRDWSAISDSDCLTSHSDTPLWHFTPTPHWHFTLKRHSDTALWHFTLTRYSETSLWHFTLTPHADTSLWHFTINRQHISYPSSGNIHWNFLYNHYFT